jgi:hypothetical protein
LRRGVRPLCTVRGDFSYISCELGADVDPQMESRQSAKRLYEKIPISS